MVSPLKKAILDRAQKQPQHSHGASRQQPPPIVAMQNSARYGKAPAHGQADIDQIGQQKTHGGGQRRGHTIQLPEKTGKNEQPQRQAKLCDGFSLYVRHSPTSEPSLPAILILPYKRWKSQHFKSEWPSDCTLRRFRCFYCLFSSCLTLKSASMRAFHSAPKGALHRTAETASLITS